MSRGGQTILVVDDDAATRTLVGAIVRGMGYALMEARNGLEALQVYGSYHSEIALIISDVQMPVMDGLEAVERIRAMHPSARIILMSGGGTEPPRLPGVCCFLSKPFTPGQLRESVARAVESDPAE